MHSYVSFNQEIRQAREVSIRAVSAAGLYGRGIFTTLAVYRGVPFLWEKNWLRLKRNAAKTGIDLSGFAKDRVKASLTALIAANRIGDGRCRLTFFDQSASRIWPGGKKSGETALLIQTGNLRKIPPQSLALSRSPYRINSTSPLAGVKTCNYLENIMALEQAREQGFDEAVRLNERHEITGACLANIFWLKNERLFTPALETGCLAGTVREFVLENREVSEVAAGPESLADADAVFLTSAGIGIVQAGSFQSRDLSAEPHELTRLILDVGY